MPSIVAASMLASMLPGTEAMAAPAVAGCANSRPGSRRRPGASVGTGPAVTKTALYAIAVGYNHSPAKDLPTLKYADDDAVRNYRLMRMLGAQSALLAHLDRQSRELYPKVEASTPTRGALFAALAAINGRIDQAKRRGQRTVLYLFYSGHGDVDRGEGYVQLHGGRLTRTALVELLRRSRADVNHVIVDACKSYFLVFSRGTGGKRRRATGRFLPDEKQLPSNTGFMLSTSSAQDSHEWEAYQAGIFSHEIRSALRGAADVNADRVVTYEEASAFVYTANKAVPNQRYRPRFVSRPQANKPGHQAALVDLRDATARRIVFGPRLKRRFFVEDRWGVRLADLHPGGREVVVLVPRAGRLFVRDPGSGLEYPVDGSQRVVALAALTPRRLTSRSRGAEHESFKRLFAEPFGQRAIVAYRRRPAESIDDPPATSTATRWLRPALGLFAVAALATGGVFTGLALKERASVEDETPNATRQEVNRRIGRNNSIAVASYVVGAAAAAGYLLWRLWPRPKAAIRVSSGLSLDGPARLQVRW